MPTDVIYTDIEAAKSIVLDRSNSKLRCFLESILTNRQTLADVAQLSHRHQLGFLKLTLLSNDIAGSLRIHIWDQPTQIQEDIHSHCAEFQSRVVFGSITENTFTLKTGCSHSLFRYCFDKNKGHAVAIENGATGVQCLARRLITTNEIYTKLPNELHSVSNAATNTVTVSTWGPRIREALVLKSLGARSQDCIAAIGIEPERVATHLQRIIEII